MIIKFNLLAAIVFSLMLIGCGGGDTTALNDLQGHNIYMDSGNGLVKIGTVSYSNFVTTYQVGNLSIGDYTFSVTAFDSQGIESSFSQTANISVTS